MKRYIRSDIDYSNASARELKKYKKEWEEQHAALQAEYDSQNQNYNSIYSAWIDQMLSEVKSDFADDFAKLPALKIDISKSWDSWEIEFNYNYDGYHATDKVCWKYRVRMDGSGNIKSEASQWNLAIATVENADELITSANFIKKLINVDWSKILNRVADTAPKKTDYVTAPDPQYSHRNPGFDRLIREAERKGTLSEVCGKDVWVKAYTNRSYTEWVKVLSQTPKFYNLLIYYTNPCYSNDWKTFETARKRKDNYYIQTPIEILTDDEFEEELGVDTSGYKHLFNY